MKNFLCCLATGLMLAACGSDQHQEERIVEEERDFSEFHLPGVDKYTAQGPERRELDPEVDAAKMALPVESDELVAAAEGIGGTGDLKVTLLWDFPADIDLHVLEPNGNEISYRNRKDSRTGGSLDVDNRTGGEGSAENIFWSNPQSGLYKVWIHYFSGSIRNGAEGSGDCNVVIFRKGQQPMTFRVPMRRKDDRKDVVSFTL